MPTIAATKYGVAGSSLISSWTSARETGTFVTNQPTTANSTALTVIRGSKTGVNYRVIRAFLAFDLSAYAGQTITNLFLTFRQTTGTVSGGLEIAVLKSTAQGSGSTFSDLTTSDFYSTIDFSTEYANFIPYWSSVNSDNIQFLTDAAMVDASSGQLRLVIVQLVNDKLNVTPTSDQEENGNWNLDTGSSGFIPFLTFNATDLGEKVNSVPIGTIEKVNGVPRSTIESINRFDLPDGSYAWKLYDVQSNSASTAAYTSVNPQDLAVGDVIYLNDSLTTVAANINEQLCGIYGWWDGSPYCSSSGTLVTTNTSGVITGFTCWDNGI
tara:strand:- start:42 stop:1016 length:975 start_codon:yes stop_codon:yes gene_type:complete